MIEIEKTNKKAKIWPLGLSALFCVSACLPESDFELLIGKGKVPQDIILPVQYTGEKILEFRDFAEKSNYKLYANCKKLSSGMGGNLLQPSPSPSPEDSTTPSIGEKKSQEQSTPGSTEEAQEIPLEKFAVHYDGKVVELENGEVQQTAHVVVPLLQLGTPYCLDIGEIRTQDADLVMGTRFHFSTQGKRKSSEMDRHEVPYNLPSEIFVYPAARFKQPTTSTDSENFLVGHAAYIEDLRLLAGDKSVSELLQTSNRLKSYISQIGSLASSELPLVVRFQSKDGKANLDPSSLSKAIRICKVKFDEKIDASNRKVEGYTSNINDCESSSSSNSSTNFDVFQIVDISPGIEQPEQMQSHYALYAFRNTVGGDFFDTGYVYKIWFNFQQSGQSAPDLKKSSSDPKALTFLYLEDSQIYSAEYLESLEADESVYEKYARERVLEMAKQAELPAPVSIANLSLKQFFNPNSTPER